MKKNSCCCDASPPQHAACFLCHLYLTPFAFCCLPICSGSIPSLHFLLNVSYYVTTAFPWPLISSMLTPECLSPEKSRAQPLQWITWVSSIVHFLAPGLTLLKTNKCMTTVASRLGMKIRLNKPLLLNNHYPFCIREICYSVAPSPLNSTVTILNFLPTMMSNCHTQYWNKYFTFCWLHYFLKNPEI